MIGLYYPYIHFRIEARLKLAALYWDRIGRIVPNDYPVNRHDSRTVRQLAEELGFILDLPPRSVATDSVGEKFLELIDKHQGKLRDLYGVHNNHYSFKQDNRQVPLFDVSDQKMSIRLRNALSDTGLAVYDERPNGWVYMHGKLATVYMSALAEETAAMGGYHPVTDTVTQHLALTGCTMERLAQILLTHADLLPSRPTEQEIESKMASVALRSVVPRDIEHVPTKKIIQVRKRFSDELTVFQDHLHTLVTELKDLREINDPQDLQNHVEVEYEKRLKPELDRLSRLMRSVGIDTATSVLNVKVSAPTIFGYVGAVDVLNINQVVAGGGAVALSILPVLRDKRKEATAALHSSPATYLLHVQEELQPSSVRSHIAWRARRIFLGA